METNGFFLGKAGDEIGGQPGGCHRPIRMFLARNVDENPVTLRQRPPASVVEPEIERVKQLRDDSTLTDLLRCELRPLNDIVPGQLFQDVNFAATVRADIEGIFRALSQLRPFFNIPTDQPATQC